MAPKHVPPAIDLRSFSCPRCGAHADQTWFEVFAEEVDEKVPFVVTQEVVANWKRNVETSRTQDEQTFKDAQAHLEKLAAGLPELRYRGSGSDAKWVDHNLENIFVSRC